MELCRGLEGQGVAGVRDEAATVVMSCAGEPAAPQLAEGVAAESFREVAARLVAC